MENINRKQSRNEQRTHEKGNKKQKTKAEASNQSSHFIWPGPLFHSSAVFVVLFLLPPLRLFSSPAQSLYLQMFSLPYSQKYLLLRTFLFFCFSNPPPTHYAISLSLVRLHLFSSVHTQIPSYSQSQAKCIRLLYCIENSHEQNNNFVFERRKIKSTAAKNQHEVSHSVTRCCMPCYFIVTVCQYSQYTYSYRCSQKRETNDIFIAPKMSFMQANRILLD